MPEFVTIPDASAGSAAAGRVRYERRGQPGAAPPLVLLGGMTQTLASWSAHLRPMSAHREVLAYEARGQGMTELDLTDCSPARHVEDFLELVRAWGLEGPIDLCGFSFGGRVCLGIAATRPELVRRLVVSGVGYDRSVVSRLIVAGWIASLRTGDLEALARICLTDILGGSYLEKNEAHLEGIIKTTVARNRYEGIRALFEQTLQLPVDARWHPRQLARHVRCPALFLGGAEDRIASPAEVRALAEATGAPFEILPDAGHTIPIESPGLWRARVEGFLGAE